MGVAEKDAHNLKISKIEMSATENAFVTITPPSLVLKDVRNIILLFSFGSVLV